MSSSSFPYNWENVIQVTKKHYSIINFKESNCDLYTIDYISQSPIHCSKVDLKCVLKSTNFPGKQANGYMFETNCSSIEHQLKKLGDGFNKKGGRISTHSLCLITNYWPLQNNENFSPEILFLKSNRRTYVITIPGVSCLVD